MPNLTSVGITNGVPTSGTGTVSTIDALMAQLAAPTVISRGHQIAEADGAQTDFALLTASAGQFINITEILVNTGAGVTANVACTIGFGATNTPTPSKAGTNGIVIDDVVLSGHNGIHRGDGSGVVAKGGDGEDLRITCGTATGGKLFIEYTYYVTAS